MPHNSDPSRSPRIVRIRSLSVSNCRESVTAAFDLAKSGRGRRVVGNLAGGACANDGEKPELRTIAVTGRPAASWGAAGRRGMLALLLRHLELSNALRDRFVVGVGGFDQDFVRPRSQAG